MQIQQVSPGRGPRKKTCLGINQRCEAVDRCLRLVPLAGTVTWRGEIIGFIQGELSQIRTKNSVTDGDVGEQAGCLSTAAAAPAVTSLWMSEAFAQVSLTKV